MKFCNFFNRFYILDTLLCRVGRMV